jgi:hypothetical protein
VVNLVLGQPIVLDPNKGAGLHALAATTGAELLDLMSGQVVRDHDVARPQLFSEPLLEAVEHKRSEGSITAQTRREGCSLPMPVRNGSPTPLAAWGASVKPGHFWYWRSFHQQRQAVLYQGLVAPRTKFLAPRLPVRGVARRRAPSFFKHDLPTIERTPKRGDSDGYPQAPQFVRQFS